MTKRAIEILREQLYNNLIITSNDDAQNMKINPTNK